MKWDTVALLSLHIDMQSVISTPSVPYNTFEPCMALPNLNFVAAKFSWHAGANTNPAQWLADSNKRWSLRSKVTALYANHGASFRTDLETTHNTVRQYAGRVVLKYSVKPGSIEI